MFGGICRETREVFVVPVPTRDRDTLLGVIKEKILPGTTVISDCWKAYDCLEAEGNKHYKVNHSVNFVDPDSHFIQTMLNASGEIPNYWCQDLAGGHIIL